MYLWLSTHTLWFKKALFFTWLQILDMLTDFYNIQQTVCWVNLQHNNYWLIHFTCALLLRYLGKQVECIMMTFSHIDQRYTLQLHSLNQHPAYLHKQSEFKNYSWNILLLMKKLTVLCINAFAVSVSLYTLCLKKRPTFKLSLTLSNPNRFSKCLHCWKAYEICYKSHMTILTLP